MNRANHARVRSWTDKEGHLTTRPEDDPKKQLGLFGAVPASTPSSSLPQRTPIQLGLDLSSPIKAEPRDLKINLIFVSKLVLPPLRRQIQDLLDAALHNAKCSGILKVREGVSYILPNDLPILHEHVSAQYPDDFQLLVSDGTVNFTPLIGTTDKEAGRR